MSEDKRNPDAPDEDDDLEGEDGAATIMGLESPFSGNADGDPNSTAPGGESAGSLEGPSTWRRQPAASVAQGIAQVPSLEGGEAIAATEQRPAADADGAPTFRRVSSADVLGSAPERTDPFAPAFRPEAPPKPVPQMDPNATVMEMQSPLLKRPEPEAKPALRTSKRMQVAAAEPQPESKAGLGTSKRMQVAAEPQPESKAGLGTSKRMQVAAEPQPESKAGLGTSKRMQVAAEPQPEPKPALRTSKRMQVAPAEPEPALRKSKSIQAVAAEPESEAKPALRKSKPMQAVPAPALGDGDEESTAASKDPIAAGATVMLESPLAEASKAKAKPGAFSRARVPQDPGGEADVPLAEQTLDVPDADDSFAKKRRATIVAAVIGLLGVVVVGAVVFGSGGEPQREELLLAYPYGVEGGRGARGEYAPGAEAVGFKLEGEVECSSHEKCLRYRYSAEGFTGTMIVGKDRTGAWVRASDEGMPFRIPVGR